VYYRQVLKVVCLLIYNGSSYVILQPYLQQQMALALALALASDTEARRWRNGDGRK
jgi:hypothetical protein